MYCISSSFQLVLLFTTTFVCSEYLYCTASVNAAAENTRPEKLN